MSDRTPVEELSAANITAVTRTIDWREAGGEYGEGLQYWQSFSYELDDTTYTLVATDQSVTGVIVDDNVYSYDEFDDYIDAHDEEGALTKDEFEALFNVEPYLHGAEGPMMNFFYPLDGFRGSPDFAASLLSNMCLVMVGDDYGLALTGGGMDMTWYIVMSYVALGFLPPVHHCDYPGYAIDGDAMRYLGQAMIRSCKVAQERAQYRIDTLATRIDWTAS